MHEEEQNIDIREKLLNLPKVKAGDDFLNALQRKINLAEAEDAEKKSSVKQEKKSFFAKLFGKNRSPWMIPSFSLTIVAIFVISVYVLNTKKVSDVPLISNYQKDEMSPSLTPEIKKPQSDEKDKVYSQNLESENRKSTESGLQESDSKKINSSIDFEQSGRIIDNRISPNPVVAPKSDEVSRPSTSEPMKNESEQQEIRKEEKMNKDIDKSTETISPRETEKSLDQIIQKVIGDDKSKGKEGVESKGVIEKKDKKESKAMKKSSKNPVDSTKIDSNALEKIKEEINKEK